MIAINMKMPEKCSQCNLENGNHHCSVTGIDISRERDIRRSRFCPLCFLNDGIKIGDEVKNTIIECNGLVTFVWQNGDVEVVIVANGKVAVWAKENVERTGRYFDEVRTLLQKMRGE